MRKENHISEECKRTGMIVRTAPVYQTVLDDEGNLWQCALRGKFRLHNFRTTHPAAVGDRVEFVPVPGSDHHGTIVRIFPRQNFLVRRAPYHPRLYQVLGANLDQAILIVTVIQPVTSTYFIDRFLIACEDQEIPAILLVNKLDLYGEKEKETFRTWQQVYESAGYTVLGISVRTGEGLDRLRKHISHRLSLIAGHSGVGKSSLINCLIPGIELPTQEVSEKTGRGRHTTTFTCAYALPEGGWLVDTPGIHEFDVVDLDVLRLRFLYPEIAQRTPDCRFSDCLHVQEPGCAVRSAVERGEIARFRYENYLRLLRWIRAQRPW